MSEAAGRLLVTIAGPTASGKSALACAVARALGTEVLSVDARQLYRGMPVGTAQPTAAERAGVPHHFIGEADVTERYTCVRFEHEALERLEELFAVHRCVVAVGGSGLYMRALCEGLDALPDADPALRGQLLQRLSEQGVGALAEELGRLDPVTFQRIDRHNPARVVRALEVCMLAGRPVSELRRGEGARRPFHGMKWAIEVEREALCERIDRRLEAMLEAGLVAEVQALYPYRTLPALRTVGYTELFAWMEGRTSFEEAVAAIRRNTRRYAKRQMTWLRREAGIEWVAPDAAPRIVERVRGWLAGEPDSSGALVSQNRLP